MKFYRLFERYETQNLNFLIRLFNGDKFIEIEKAVLNDISLTGVSFTAKNITELRDLIILELSFEGQKFFLNGNVMRVKKMNNELVQYAIKLKFIKKSSFVKWFNLIRKYDMLLHEENNSRVNEKLKVEKDKQVILSDLSFVNF